MEALFVIILISFLTAYFIGTKRAIGFKWSLIFGLVSGGLIGIIITFCSRKLYDGLIIESSNKRKYIGIFWIILGLIFSFTIIKSINESNKIVDIYADSLPPLLMVFSGIFLIERSKGKSFNL